MASRRPLALISGVVREITDGDSLPPAIVLAREKLTAPRTYYVRTDGSDSNTGLANTSGGAFLTVQKAVDVLSAFDLNNQTATISIGAGGWTENVTLRPLIGGAINLTGAGVSSTTLTTTGTTFTTDYPGRYLISGIKFLGSGGSSVCVVRGGGNLTFTNVEVGNGFNWNVFFAAPYSQVQFGGTLTVSATSLNTLLGSQGFIAAVSVTIAFPNGCAFAGSFCSAGRGGIAEVYSTTFSGTVTGARYNVYAGGIIFVNSAGANYLPGNSAGGNDGTGVYA